MYHQDKIFRTKTKRKTNDFSKPKQLFMLRTKTLKSNQSIKAAGEKTESSNINPEITY